MPLITLRHRPTVNNAPLNAADLAIRLRDSLDPDYLGQQPTPGGRCALCGKESGQLYVIVLDQERDDRVEIGFGTCHSQHLANAVEELLAEEIRANHQDRQDGIARLRHALQHLG